MASISCSRTGLDKFTTLHTWVIEDFSLYPQEHDMCLESDRFTTKDPDYEWKLKLYPYVHHNVSVYLYFCSPPTATAKVKLWIVDEKKLPYKPVTLGVRTFTKRDDYASGNVVSKRDLFDVSKGLLPDDTLTLCCELTVLRPATERGPEVLPAPTLRDDIGRLLQGEDHSDIRLVAGKKEFHVHKVILATRSPVFRAMFQHGTKERSENRVTIEDLNPEVLEEMLRYVYTNTVENLGTLTTGLLQAAVKYDIPGLRSLCEAHIWSSVSVENAVDTYRLADKHDLADLKECTVGFVERNVSRVAGTDGWKRALQEDPGIAKILFCEWCSQVKRKAE